MFDDTVVKLGSDIADIAYKLNLLEDEVAKLNAYINELKQNKGEDND
tara:strand:+ start:115 stop:255 length:141 start_codon:yes stop_codon:yes gene_type:complete